MLKRSLSLLLCAVMFAGTLAFAGCGKKPFTTTASEEDIAKLNSLYAGKTAFFGEMHDHSDSGGRSDGKVALKDWPTQVMQPKDIDFAVIVDHRQSLHMRLPEWDSTKFVGGTEPASYMTDEHVKSDSVHYNVILDDPDKQDALFQSLPEYKYGPDSKVPNLNTIRYPDISIERLREVAAKTLEMGGFFVHVHPLFLSYMQSDIVTDYWMGDYTGFEIYTAGSKNYLPSWPSNQKAYKTWVELLNLGKKLYATCGSDSHRESNVNTLSTFYAESTDSKILLNLMRAGNFTAGPVGIRMAVGDTCTGGETDFTGKRLVVSVGDFHSQAYQADHQYRLNVYNEKGLVFSQDLTGTDTVYYAIDTTNCEYYRAEVYDVTGDYAFSVGNPIWNTKSN